MPAGSRAAERRAATLERLDGASVDLLVIGGGIVGSRVAYEASRRGLRVVLVDAGDFGGATSSASSKLVHGGLRYLACGDIRLVRELQAERKALGTRIAPHLVQPLPLVLGVERAHPQRLVKLVAALGLYSLVSGLSRPLPVLIDTARAASLIPALDPSTLCGCGLVLEAITHDARLTLATVTAAVGAGALAANYVRVDALERGPGNRVEAVLHDRDGGANLVLRARAVVNAAGPWVDSVRRLDDPAAGTSVRLSKGVHALLPLREPWSAGLALFDDSRSAFAVPWQGMLMLGVTDTEFDGDPGDAAPTAADVESLLAAFRPMLPGSGLRREEVVRAFAGLRVLQPGANGTARASRRHEIVVAPGGMVSILSGKLTTHRRIAVDALRRLPADVRPRALHMDDAPLRCVPGPTTARTLRRRAGEELGSHLLHLYGRDAVGVLECAETVSDYTRVHPGGPDIWAQVHFAVEREWALTVDDVLERRTTLAARGLDGGPVRDAVAAVLEAYAPTSARA